MPQSLDKRRIVGIKLEPAKRAVLINTVLSNGGDAAIASAIKQCAKEKNIVIETIVDLHPRVTSNLFKEVRIEGHLKSSWSFFGAGRLNNLLLLIAISAFKFRLKGFALKLLGRNAVDRHNEYRSYDLIINTGGTYLREIYDLRSRWAEILVARISGRPLVFMSQSIGPFHAWRNKFAVKVLLSDVAIVCRDGQSKKCVEAIVGPSQRLSVGEDIAFALAPDQVRFKAKNFGMVAISVRSWPYGDTTKGATDSRVVQSFAKLVDHISSTGKKIVFLSTCQGLSGYAYDDSQFALRIYQELSVDVRKKVEIDRKWRNTDQLIADLKQFDWIVSMRMHAMILALISGTPAVPIAYEFKTLELAKRLGIMDFSLPIDKIDPKSLVDVVSRFSSSLDSIRGTLDKSVNLARQDAREAFFRALDWID